jgi:hypothetical protein
VTAPAVSVSVSPASGLTDGQIVALHATGLPAEHTIQVEECAGTLSTPPPDNTACDGLTLDTQAGTDASGNYVNAPGANGSSGYLVYSRPSPLLNSPTTIICDATHPCVLYVGVDQNDFSKPHAFAEIRFGPGVVAPATTPPAPGIPVISGAPVGGQATLTHLAAPATTAPVTTAPASAGVAGDGAASLAFTGPAPLAPGLAGLGLVGVLLASLGRRRMLRGADR